MAEIVVRRFDDGAWSDENAKGDNPTEMIEKARAAGYRRKQLLAGEGEVYLTHIEMGPGFTVAPHSHNKREIIHVIAGSLTPAGHDRPLEVGDSIVVPEGEVYGFTVGDAGVKFLIFRPGAAGISHVS